MESANENIAWEECWSWMYFNDDDNNRVDVLDSGDQLTSQNQGSIQSSQNQLPEMATKDVFAATSSGVQADITAELALEKSREYNQLVTGSGIESEGKNKEVLSQNKNAIETSQSILIGTSCSEADAANLDQRQRKRKIDQAYRKRVRETKQKMEEELQKLRQEIENKKKIEEELQMLRQEFHLLQEKVVKSDRNRQENRPPICRVIFELSFPNDEAKAKAMSIVGSFPGITSITMDMKDKKLSLKGEDIDPFPLREMLKNICDTKLLSFNVEQKYPEKKEEKKEEKKKDYMEAYSPLHPPYYHGPPYPYSYADMTRAEAMQHVSLKKAAAIFVLLIVVLIIVRFAP